MDAGENAGVGVVFQLWNCGHALPLISYVNTVKIALIWFNLKVIVAITLLRIQTIQKKINFFIK